MLRADRPEEGKRATRKRKIPRRSAQGCRQHAMDRQAMVPRENQKQRTSRRRAGTSARSGAASLSAGGGRLPPLGCQLAKIRAGLRGCARGGARDGPKDGAPASASGCCRRGDRGRCGEGPGASSAVRSSRAHRRSPAAQTALVESERSWVSSRVLGTYCSARASYGLAPSL